MLYTEIIAVCSEIHTKHKYTVWAERRNCVCWTGGKYSDHWALKGSVLVAVADYKGSPLEPWNPARIHNLSQVQG
jgi:hypothetical protein